MSDALFIAEVARKLDDRYRLTLPPEIVPALVGLKLADTGGSCLIAKERPGCLSLWSLAEAQRKLDQGIHLLESKLAAGKFESRIGDLQRFGRLLSTRQREAPLAARGRLVIPDGFREFLGAEPGGTVMVVGAAVCVELWEPTRWAEFIGQEMPGFTDIFEQLAS